MSQLALVGGGISCATLARVLAQHGLDCTVFEERAHLGGNCHTRRDPETGVMLHVYGPHIFHTADEEVWDFVRNYADFRPFKHMVMATAGGQVYDLPVNLHTVNQFFGQCFSPKQARAHIEALAQAYSQTYLHAPQSFEEQGRTFLGDALYQAFFDGYTRKQWGCEPGSLPASILKRLPLRFNYEKSYFPLEQNQGIPAEGYTALVERLIDHPRITVRRNTHFAASQCADFDHVFYSGPLDVYFEACYGKLGYRTLDFETFRVEGDFQGCAVMNYCDADIPYTRITEHKFFAPWEQHPQSICYREYSREHQAQDIPYYPVPLPENQRILHQYQEKTQKEQGITFIGRLGTYRYLDMDTSVREALDTAHLFLYCQQSGQKMPAFCKL